jgi:hypothetical protein
MNKQVVVNTNSNANSNNTTTSTTNQTTNSNDLAMLNNAITNQNPINSTANSNSTPFKSNHANTTLTNQTQPSASVLLLQQPQQPRVHKAWHENINAEMRRNSF